MNHFQNAVAQAFASIRCAAGQEVTYHRGDDWTKAVAVVGRTDFALDDDGTGVLVQSRSRDFMFQSRDLYFGDTPITPQRDDTIKEVVGDKVHVHEVVAPGGGEHVWRYMDHDRSAIRVHTKLREVVDR